MAIAYLEMKIVSRGNATQCRNCVGASAYNSREKMYSTDNGHTYNYNFKSADVENKNVLLPKHAPQEYKNRQTLWQAVEKAETSVKAQLARKIILALPKETTPEQRKELVENYCNTAFVKEGMCVDYAIHKADKGNENYHCHIMLTMRSIDKKGNWKSKKNKIYVLDKNGKRIPIIDKETGKQKIGDKGRLMFKTQTIKINDWDNPQNLEKWRHLAEQAINKYLPKENQISMKSYERQGLAKIGQVHEGYSNTSGKKRFNVEIKYKNEKNAKLNKFEKDLARIKINVANEKLHELQPNQENTFDKWELYKEYNRLISEVDKQQEKLEQKKEKIQLLIKRAKKAGKDKWFFQNEKAVVNSYLKDNGYIRLKKEIVQLIAEIEKIKVAAAKLEIKIWGKTDKDVAAHEQQQQNKISLNTKARKPSQIPSCEQQQNERKQKAKLVKSEWQKQRKKEKNCGKDGWSMHR